MNALLWLVAIVLFITVLILLIADSIIVRIINIYDQAERDRYDHHGR